ncbi:MAG: acetylglutamate kinase [Acidimicrobiales bacterium]
MTGSERPEEVAPVLLEALPYIRRFSGRVIVVKYGGSALDTGGSGAESALASFAQDIVLLASVGIRPVVVHGGGPQIGAMMRRLGKEAEFQDGLRVTDLETLEIARMVLVGKVNREFVSAINAHGPLAVGLSGEDARLITAVQRSADLGYVGDIAEVDPKMLEGLIAQGLVPVIASVGIDTAGQAYNINADTAAGAIAASLRADKLVYMTDVQGVQSSGGETPCLLEQVSVPEVARLVDDGVVYGGMIPKLESAANAVKAGVRRAHLLDGTVPHALLVELFTDSGVGTMVVP